MTRPSHHTREILNPQPIQTFFNRRQNIQVGSFQSISTSQNATLTP